MDHAYDFEEQKGFYVLPRWRAEDPGVTEGFNDRVLSSNLKHSLRKPPLLPPLPESLDNYSHMGHVGGNLIMAHGFVATLHCIWTRISPLGAFFVLVQLQVTRKEVFSAGCASCGTARALRVFVSFDLIAAVVMSAAAVSAFYPEKKCARGG